MIKMWYTKNSLSIIVSFVIIMFLFGKKIDKRPAQQSRKITLRGLQCLHQ